MNGFSYDFHGEKVLITGASRGIGHGIAKAFAKAGAQVSILASGEDVHGAAAALSEEVGGRVRGYQCDITDAERVRATMAEIGTLDILVANAGLERITPITDTSPEVEATFRRIIDINVIGTYLVTREAVSRMSAGARIIITSSVWGKSAIGEFSAYICSKHANIGFMRSLARELGPKGIRVNCVCPGWVKTDAAMLSLRRISEEEGRPEEEILNEITGTQCMGGLQEPDDVPGPYLFLASPLAANVTGAVVERGPGRVFGLTSREAREMQDRGVRLDGKTALVVGASSGIGLAVANSFNRYGAEVAILAQDETVHEAARSLSEAGGRPVSAIKCDITNRQALRAALVGMRRIDVLVNNAGFERITPIDNPDPGVEEDFRKILDVNLLGAYYVIREAIAKIPDGGRIIFTASTYAKYAIAEMCGYASSKHAVLGLMRSLAQELGPRRITVNAVCPGWVNTEFSNRSVREIAAKSGRSFDEVGNDVLSLQAIEGHLEPDDMAGGYLFLASDLAKDITGQSLHIDRGEFQS